MAPDRYGKKRRRTDGDTSNGAQRSHWEPSMLVVSAIAACGGLLWLAAIASAVVFDFAEHQECSVTTEVIERPEDEDREPEFVTSQITTTKECSDPPIYSGYLGAALVLGAALGTPLVLRLLPRGVDVESPIGKLKTPPAPTVQETAANVIDVVIKTERQRFD